MKGSLPSFRAATEAPVSNRGRPRGDRARRRAFTLLEVMIACGIFFMATFGILALVANTLRNARALQRSDVDSGMAAAQVYQMLKTNVLSQGSFSGDFGDAYRDYSWDATWDVDWDSGATNGLLKVGIVVNRSGLNKPLDVLTLWVHAPNARPPAR
jgi:hypothetical protein